MKSRDESFAEGALRRREKDAATVALAVRNLGGAYRDRVGRRLTGDAARGETLYETCQDATRSTRAMSDRVIGAYSGARPLRSDYDDSDALKSANIVWNEETLDKWLTDPQAVAPGAKMFFHLDDPQDRLDVIAYLKERAK